MWLPNRQESTTTPGIDLCLRESRFVEYKGELDRTQGRGKGTIRHYGRVSDLFEKPAGEGEQSIILGQRAKREVERRWRVLRKDIRNIRGLYEPKFALNLRVKKAERKRHSEWPRGACWTRTI